MMTSLFLSKEMILEELILLKEKKVFLDKGSPERIKINKRIWRLENIDKSRKSRRLSSAKKRATDPNYFKKSLEKWRSRNREQELERRRVCMTKKRWGPLAEERRLFLKIKNTTTGLFNKLLKEMDA